MKNTHATNTVTSTSRSRWAAIGAAIAVTLGAGGIGISHAATDSGDGAVSAFFPIEPCRLASNEAILADSSVTLDGWGESGECELPDGITGLAANVTAVGATQQTNVRFYAQGADVPGTANLNPSPGAPPTPNAVNITLNGTNGQFEVYNRFGQVAVFIDVMGYYDDHTHDDRYYTEAEVDTALSGAAGVEYTRTRETLLVDDSVTVLESIVVDVPAAGILAVTASTWTDQQTGVALRCGLSTNPAAFQDDQAASQIFSSGAQNSVAMTRGFEIGAGETIVYFVCRRDTAGADIGVTDRNMTAVFSTNRP